MVSEVSRVGGYLYSDDTRIRYSTPKADLRCKVIEILLSWKKLHADNEGHCSVVTRGCSEAHDRF